MLNVSVLGEQRFLLNDTSITGVLSRRAVEIVAYLALHPGRPQPRSALAAAVWPDSTDAQALTNLRRELHHLRSVLGADCCVTADARTVWWQTCATNHCDLADFVEEASAAKHCANTDGAFRVHALRAVGTYAGDLLPASRAEWVDEQRESLHRRCVQLLDQLIEAEEHGSLSQALEHAQQRLALEPMEEASYQVLMRLQSVAGDRAAAIQTYHRCVAILDKELGVGPDPSTVALYGRLIAADTPQSPTGTEGSVGKEPSLVGRDRELTSLLEWRHRADPDVAPLHLVIGEAGLGKTRLIREVARKAVGEGVRVAAARCYEGPGRIALGPVAEWLGSDSMRSGRADLDAEWRAEVDRLLPPAAGTDTTTPTSPMVDGWQRHHFFEGLARALLQPKVPTLLVLDDLQWCDIETLSWLPLFLEVSAGQPVQVLAGIRDLHVRGHPALSSTLKTLRASGLSVETELEPLTAQSSAELAGTMLRRELSEQEARGWHDATGGVPLFVIETARSRSGRSPSASEVGQLPRVQAVLRARLEEVSPRGRDVAGLAAAFGREFRLDLLSEASDHSENETIDAVDELWRRRILRDSEGGAYDFTHDLLREAAYDQTSPPMRPLLHRRIAQAIELLSDGETRAVAAELAEQYDRAQLPGRAIRNYAIAAEGATEVFAYSSAVRRYARALELLDDLTPGRDRDQLELTLRHAMSMPINALEGYASPTLRSTLERSSQLAERLDQPRLLLLSLVGLFSVRFVQGDVAESYRLGERALALSPAYPDLAGQAHMAVGGAASELGRHELAVEHLRLAHELSIDQPAALVGTRPEVHGRAWSAHSLWALGRDDEAVHWAHWAIARAEEMEQPYSMAVALAYAAITHQLRRDLDATRDYAQRTVDICRRYEFAYYGWWGVILGGWCLGGDEGGAQIGRGLEALRSAGALARHPYYLSLLADVQLGGGQSDAAAFTLDRALALARQNDDRWWVPDVMRLKARTVNAHEAAELRRQARALAEADGAVALVERLDTEP